MRILLLSAYDGTSHRYWRQGLVANFGQHQWTVLTLPGRHFNWRIRGNPLSWLATESERLSVAYDLIVATSMVDIATLKGLFPNLGKIPTLCYFHENQFQYPQRDKTKRPLEAMMVNLYSALAADRLLFNSQYNQDSFFDGADKLMKQLPDFRPKSIRALLAGKSSVLPVPMNTPTEVDEPVEKADVFTLVWNHRWEHDKAPERLYLLLKQLQDKSIPFRLHLLGECFRDEPQAITLIKAEFADYLGCCGYQADKKSYWRCLYQSHLVLSTSLHEFQGLAVLEGVAAGAVPVIPDRLSYQEMFAEHYRYSSCIEDAQTEAQAMANKVEQFYRQWLKGECLAAPSVTGFDWAQLRQQYAEQIDNTLRMR